MIAKASFRWSVEQRLEFIEFQLFWEGGVNRADITRHFGVSVPQASKDLSQYQALAPANITYDRRLKRYFATKNFKARFLTPDPDRYLSQLRLIDEGAISLDESWVSRAPAVAAVPMPRRHVHAAVLRAALFAVREKCALEICYQSLTGTPRPTWRWISPHAFAHDGSRWHVRAFCHIDRTFKDFLLPRFLKTRHTAEPAATQQDDEVWNEFMSVVLKPHPGLSSDEKLIIAQDYGMKGGELDIKIRLALVFYLLRRLNLDFHEEKRAPREQQVVLANPGEVKVAVARAGLAPSSAAAAAV